MSLHPATLILSTYTRAAKTWGLTFFIGRMKGAYRFINCSNQDFDKAGFWTVTPCVISAFLFSRGYYGPISIDVLEDAHDGQWVMHMNVQAPESMLVGVLKGHFSTERGLHVAYMLSGIKYPYSREMSLQMFSVQFAQGRIVIFAWYEELPDGNDSISWANLAMGGETRKELYKLLARIKDATINENDSNAQKYQL